MKKLVMKLFNKKRKYLRRKNRTNTIAKLSLDLPRLIVNRSNKFIYAQVIDATGKVIASCNDLKITDGTKIERANKVGLMLSDKLKKENIDNVCFDRNGYLFHGRVKSLADGAKAGGIKL